LPTLFAAPVESPPTTPPITPAFTASPKLPPLSKEPVKQFYKILK
jgi:hypothetical protein